MYTHAVYVYKYMLLTASRLSCTCSDILNPLICVMRSTNSKAGMVPVLSVSRNLKA